ncbi:MAG TPA: hemerythrin domain-containing protein [Candidatus Ozemobacteraceae bacterium]|nr:hemerythrin domain-containing protein [Candidatus Ozemobacteraceae bacterium]
MKPSDQLRAEHDAILTMLGVLDRICLRLERREPVPQEHLTGLMEFFQVFADRCHHAKEEEFLFPAYEQAGVPRDHGPIGCMLAEHQQGRQEIARMKQAIEGMTAGQREAVAVFVAAARGYRELLEAHIEKENQVLFPMGDRLVTPDRQETLLKEFDQLEETRIGAGKHEAFHRLIETLEATYSSESSCTACGGCCCG